MKKTLFGMSMLVLGAATLLSSCSSNRKAGGGSSKTGWSYGDSKLGGFENPTNYVPNGPGTVFIEGGRFTMGQTEEDLTMDRNNIARTVSVSSFYMDQTEVANVHYREYIHWMTRAYVNDYPLLVVQALPDTASWREAMSYNEPLVNYYFRHNSYSYYPVVGVNWNQAREYCKWRTDRVNEKILIELGALRKNPNQTNEDVFTTDTYINGQYQGTVGKNPRKDLNPSGAGTRTYNMSDGVFVPEYRLPTEAEWEYAALGLIENNPEPRTKRRRGEEVITNRKVFPWGDAYTTRSGFRNQYQGQFLGNFKRGKGDQMGVAGGLNDNADIPADIYSYKPNAYGLYNMAGNVSEWVLDTYRPTSPQDVNDFRPFRGNSYDTYKRIAEDNSLEDKDSLGHLSTRPLDISELSIAERNSYRNSDLRNFKDGDTISQYTYDYGKTTLVNDDARVYKGASWADRAYWLSPGTRRYAQANHASPKIGFRCVQDKLGPPVANASRGNYFGKKNK
jgi:gliding motility-associated lipoprotein GldJ